jgi:hypothetical protein
MLIRHRIWNHLITKLHYLRLGKVSQRILLKPSTTIRYREREFLESLLPLEAPLSGTIKISGCVVTSKKELEILPLCLEGILNGVDSGLKNLFIIAPNHEITEIKAVVPSEVIIISDEEIIPSEISSYIFKNIPEHRQGWIKQQVLKILSAYQINENGVLIIDADTVLLRPQKWLDLDGNQNLQISAEFHDVYQKNLEQFMKLRNVSRNSSFEKLGVSFVTHYQLMQPAVLKELFENQGDSIDKGILGWLQTIDFTSTMSPISEWHTYGTFLANAHADKIRLTQWRNKSIPRNNNSVKFNLPYKKLTLNQLKLEFPKLNSVSFHHYL